GERADGAFLSFAAIGAASELPVVACSTLTCAPASAEPAVRERARHEVLVTSRPHQAGLLQGVHRLLGHSPWTCRTCGGLRHPAERRLLLAVLGAADRGPAGRVLQGLELALRASMPE